MLIALRGAHQSIIPVLTLNGRFQLLAKSAGPQAPPDDMAMSWAIRLTVTFISRTTGRH